MVVASPFNYPTSKHMEPPLQLSQQPPTTHIQTIKMSSSPRRRPPVPLMQTPERDLPDDPIVPSSFDIRTPIETRTRVQIEREKVHRSRQFAISRIIRELDEPPKEVSARYREAMITNSRYEDMMEYVTRKCTQISNTREQLAATSTYHP